MRTGFGVSMRLKVREAGSAAGALLVLASTLAACVPTESALPPRGVAVSGPPPAPIEEVAPAAAPFPAAVWVAGYWHWTGMHYAWIPGHWENAPPGTAWAAPRYVRTEAGYYYEAGTWKPAPPPSGNALR
jgi:hypothetical protein